MLRKTLTSPSSPRVRPAAPFLPQYSRRFSVTPVRAHLPLGRLWDPTLLERLHTPLTRYRD